MKIPKSLIGIGCACLLAPSLLEAATGSPQPSPEFKPEEGLPVGGPTTEPTVPE